MEANVIKELEDLKSMVLRWKRSYLGWVPDDGEGEYLLEEFSEEISRHISPFANRLFQNDHLTWSETQEFLNYCYSQVEEVREAVEQANSKQREKASEHKLVEYASGNRGGDNQCCLAGEELMLRIHRKGGRACLRNAAWVFAGSTPCSSKGM